MPRELPVEIREREGDVPGWEPWERTARDGEDYDDLPDEPPTNEELDAMYRYFHPEGK